MQPAAAAAVVSGKLVVLGGESGGQQLAHNEVEALDPATSIWTMLAPLSMGRHATQAILHDGRIYLAPVRGRAVRRSGHAGDLHARGQVLTVAQRFTNPDCVDQQHPSCSQARQNVRRSAS